MTPTQAFASARDFLVAHREDYAAAYQGFRWPQLRNLQLGARLVRCAGKGQRPAGAVGGRRTTAAEEQAQLPRAVRTLEPRRQLPARLRAFGAATASC